MCLWRTGILARRFVEVNTPSVFVVQIFKDGRDARPPTRCA